MLLFQYRPKSKLFGTISCYTLNLMKRSMKAARWQWTDGGIKILVSKDRLELPVLGINSEKFKFKSQPISAFPPFLCLQPSPSPTQTPDSADFTLTLCSYQSILNILMDSNLTFGLFPGLLHLHLRKILHFFRNTSVKIEYTKFNDELLFLIIQTYLI